MYRKCFGGGKRFRSTDTLSLSAFDGIVPPHFYGVMAKTELGCQVLHQKGHFGEFAQFVKKHGLEQEDPDIILKLKSILWAVVGPRFFLPPVILVVVITLNRYYRGISGPLRGVCRF